MDHSAEHTSGGVSRIDRPWIDLAWRWLPVALWMAGIFAFSCLPEPLGPLSDSPYGGPVGRVCHVGEYAGLAALLYRALQPGRLPSAAAVGALLLSLAYGLTDEFHQSFVPGREFSLLDLGWDGLGAVIGLVGYRAGARVRGRVEVRGE